MNTSTLERLKRRRPILLLIFGISLCACCFLSTLCWIGLIGIEDRRYEEAYFEAEIPIARGILPKWPTERDYYELAVDALNRNGWETPPRLTVLNWNDPCSSLDAPFDEMSFLFSKKKLSIGKHADSLLPHKITASIFVDASEGKMSLSLSFRDQGMSLEPLDRKLDLRRLAVDLEKALEIAEENGGQAYRQNVGDQCDVYVSLRQYIWEVAYRELSEYRDVFRVNIDARTGEYEITKPYFK